VTVAHDFSTPSSPQAQNPGEWPPGGATRLHDLRHTCVTLLLDQSTPPHVVQEIVGHSAIEITMTIYAHVSLEEKRKALRKLGEVLG
jgi:integrase